MAYGASSREVCVRLIQLQRLLKALLQPLEEEQRAAEEQHIALDLAALRQTGDGLVDDRLKDGGGNVLLARALVEQRLNIRSWRIRRSGTRWCRCAPRSCASSSSSDGVTSSSDRHLVDERAGAARAGAVHALLQLTGEEDDLRVLAAQLNDNIGLRNVHA